MHSLIQKEGLETMSYGLGPFDYLFAGVVLFIFIAAIIVLVYVGWRISAQKDKD